MKPKRKVESIWIWSKAQVITTQSFTTSHAVISRNFLLNLCTFTSFPFPWLHVLLIKKLSNWCWHKHDQSILLNLIFGGFLFFIPTVRNNVTQWSRCHRHSLVIKFRTKGKYIGYLVRLYQANMRLVGNSKSMYGFENCKV